MPLFVIGEEDEVLGAAVTRLVRIKVLRRAAGRHRARVRCGTRRLAGMSEMRSAKKLSLIRSAKLLEPRTTLVLLLSKAPQRQ